ncbi:MAG TPA: serine/threonine-protein kinase [Anaeromyxobacteraceae bacterium]|nr:serine/threonine-protein kinase [Anaeromyxobacteraceae bacterium]
MSEDLSALLARIVAPSTEGSAGTEGRPLLLPGTVVGRFRLLRILGRGGFGVVFEAEDDQLGRRVAFKALRRREPDRDDLLRREARTVAGLSHPNVVTLHDAGLADGTWYLILELLRGETLAARLSRGALGPRAAVRIASSIAAGLQHAHAAGVLHRDLKPANVFLTADGGVKLLDFGLSRVLGVGGLEGGTPGYLAPEQCRGAVEDARTDLFALGVVLAEMMSPRKARPPQVDGVPKVDAGRLPLAVRPLVSRLTSPDPAGRPRTAAMVGAELEALAQALEPATPAAPVRSVEAALALGRAEARAAQPLYGQDGPAEYRKALEIDPTLAVAHYQLALWARRFGGTADEQRASAAAALDNQASASPLHRLLIRALATELDGRVEEATRLLREAAEAFPDDPRPSYELADVLRHQDELSLCLPWLRRTLALQPDHGWALGQLAEALGALGRADELRAGLEQWEADGSVASLHAISLGRGWLGDLDGAEEAARRAVALGGGLVAQLDRVAALIMLGRYDEVEEAAAALAEPGSPVQRLGYYAKAALRAYRGRWEEGLEVLDALLRDVPGADRDVHCRSVRVDYLLGGGDPDAVVSEVLAIREIDPGAAAWHAPGLAWVGEPRRAREVGALLRPNSVPARLLEAVLTFAEGQEDAGLSLLSSVADDAPVSAWRVSAVWLLGDLAARAGRAGVAVPALERFEAQYLPRVMWRSWAHGRALEHLARLRQG